MKNITTILRAALILWICALTSYAQVPAGYYTTAASLSGYAKKTALFNIINKNYPSTTAAPINVGYGGLYSAFQGTGSNPPQGTDKKPNGQVWDMYSDNPSGTPPYVFNWGTTCGNYVAEGDCYNREHSFPQSWFQSASPMQSDIFHLYPTDGKVNGIRSNFPFGKVGTATTMTLNGSKLGNSISPGYTSTVFEPIDAYKGDFARTYFYMATRYENIVGSWQANGTANNVLDGSSNQVFDRWQLDLLYSWHIADPVSTKETDRNNTIFQIQGNRNPYIDNPLWVADVWGFSAPVPGVQFSSITGITTEPATGNTVYSVNVVANSAVAFTVNLAVGATSTATAGATNDYVLTTTTPISFAANQTSQTVLITVNADAITSEADETVVLILSSPTASVPLLANSTHTLTIKDYVVPPPVPTPTTLFDFNTSCPGGLGTFSQFSVTGVPVWACTTFGRPVTGTTTPNTGGVQINGGSSTASTANEDWLISPALTVTSNYKMDFWARTTFTGGIDLEVKVSTNYSGTGDPNLATWTTLTTLDADNSNVWFQNPQIDLSSYAGAGRRIAFIYTCIAATPSQGARWTIDDVAFYDNSTIVPTLTASPTTLTNFGTVNTNALSSVQTYTLTGVNITTNVTVTAPANFQVSKDAITFSTSVIYTPADMATPQIVSVRFAPTSAVAGLKTGNITNVSGILSQNVAVSGTEGVALPPATLTATPTSLTFGIVTTNASSAVQTYSLSGTNLVANTTVTAPANFEVSKNGTTFSASISYTVTELATAQTVSVRFSPTSLVAGLKTGNITNISGVASASVTLTGTETLPLVPTLTANPSTLTFGTVTTNLNSVTQNYLLTGANLTASTAVTAPTNFQVSKDGIAFSGTISYTTTELTTAQTVFVRFSPISAIAGLKTGNVTNISGLAPATASANVAVSGTEALVVIPPTLTATPTTLVNFGTVNTNANSAVQTYSLSGANLVASTTVTAPANFEVSKNSTTFSSSISYTVADLATPQTVSVRFSPTSVVAGVKTGNITNVSGTASANVAVTGTEALAPVFNFVNFASASTTIREGAQGSLTLLFSSPATVASTITIKALNGANATATDYSTNPALSGNNITLNVPVGATNASFIFNGVEDTDYAELNETVSFVIDAVGAGLAKGSADVSVVNITNYINPTTALNTFENATKVYPNPAKNKVFVEMAQNQATAGAVAGVFSVEIMDATGRKIDTISSDKITSEISVKDWKRGMYFFKFSNNKTQFIKKIVLE